MGLHVLCFSEGHADTFIAASGLNLIYIVLICSRLHFLSIILIFYIEYLLIQNFILSWYAFINNVPFWRDGISYKDMVI